MTRTTDWVRVWAARPVDRKAALVTAPGEPLPDKPPVPPTVIELLMASRQVQRVAHREPRTAIQAAVAVALSNRKRRK
jgi:hypothetical protein